VSYRCINDNCRQALFLILPEGLCTPINGGEISLGDPEQVEVECPVTFLEKDQLCLCGGEIIPVMNRQMAAKGRMVSPVFASQKIEPTAICENCGLPKGTDYTDPTMSAMTVEQLKGMQL
jgi:hypothetical protein